MKLHDLSTPISALTSLMARKDLPAADLFRTSTFRCPQADCDFTVRLQRGDAGQARRWQELAHSHPHIGRG